MSDKTTDNPQDRFAATSAGSLGFAFFRHVVTFSGGAASAVVAKLIADENPGTTVLLFHDTQTEPEDNYRFRREAAQFIGLPITEASDGRDIWQVFSDEGFLGNQRLTPCSKILKRIPGDTWLKANKPCKVYFGFTREEWQRACRTAARIDRDVGIECGFPLIERGIGKNDCLELVTNCWGLQLPKMYEWAEHANCVPCVKGGLAYWGMIHERHPEAWERAAQAERDTGYQILKETRYGTLEEELPHCLDLARKHEAKRNAEAAQGSLFEAPCECMA